MSVTYATVHLPLLTDRARFAHVPLKAGTTTSPLSTERARFAHVPLKAGTRLYASYTFRKNPIVTPALSKGEHSPY